MILTPPFGDGQRIGLFGGSFNPVHNGHRMVALYALKRLRLDWVWWLVSPQNPLKDRSETGDYAVRLAETRKVARHPRFVVSEFEKQAGTHTTAETIEALAPALRRGCFVWIMGADSFADLHRWNDWLDIPASLPLAVLARPGYSVRALSSQAAIRFEEYRIPSHRAASLPCRTPPAWAFVQMPLRRESSTAIRRRLTTVLAAIDRANAQDPVSQGGSPRALLYGRRMSEVLSSFSPEAGDHLAIAARAQHIERWTSPRQSYPEGRIGYLKWRKDLQHHHARRTGELMREAGYEEDDIARVGSLLKKERLKSDDEVQALEDVICLVFLQYEAPDFIALHDDEKVRDILAKTAKKMSAKGLATAAKLKLDERLARLLGEALANFAP